MKLTHQRFVDCGIQSDIEIMRREVYSLQNRLNSLSKLRKDLSKATPEDLENYVLESGLGAVYAEAAKYAESHTRVEYVQFIQEGGLSKIIGEAINERNKKEEGAEIATTEIENTKD